MTSRFAKIAAACSLILLLSACNMTVQITTQVNDRGGGTLGLRMVLDKEVRDVLEGSGGGQGIQALDDLFSQLRDAQWTVTRTEPAGGLDLRATRAFKDAKGFATAMSELSSGRSGGTGPLGGYSLGYTSHGSFFKTKTGFSGTVDTTSWRSVIAAALTKGNQQAAQALLDSASDKFHFEILATLPGSVSVSGGDGTVTNGQAIWRPALGSRVEIAATSSAIKTSSLLVVGVPGLLILAGLGWFIVGRRQRPLIAESPTPADRRRDRVKMPQPVEQLLAIVPDPPPVSGPITRPVVENNTVIELDVPEPVEPAEPTA
jgi:hypothetical protein